ncbi:Aspyridones efflux protein apdF, partial [Lachnellula suecica]
MSEPDSLHSQEKEIPRDVSPSPAREAESQNAPAKSEFTPRALLALAGCFSVTFCSVGFINAFGVFQEYYGQTILHDKSASTISWIGSFNLFCLFGGMMIAGMLEYKYGPTILMVIGSLLSVFGIFMTSLGKEYYQLFLAQGLVLGVGICLVLMPAFVNITYHFRASRGVAMGIVVSGSSLGGVIWPIALHRLIGEVGFGWAVRIAAFMMMPLYGLAVSFVRRPESLVLPPRAKPDFSFLKNPAILFLSAGMFFVYLGLFSPYFYITSWTVSLGLDANMAFYMISIMNAASLFGRVVPGLAADKMGPFNVMISIVAISGVIATCWTKATSIPGIVVFSLAYGFSSGGVMSLQGPCAVAPVQPAQYGVAMGSVMTILSVAGLIGTPITGQLLGAYGFLGVSLFSGLAMLIGAIMTLIARMFLAKGLFVK